MTQREKLIEILSRYFQIGDSYAYNLTRDKEAFAVGTMDLDDFEEFDDFTVSYIADHLLENGVIVPPVKVGQTVYYIRGGYYRKVNLEVCPITVTEISKKEVKGKLQWAFIANGTRYVFGSIGKTVFLSREEAEKALSERSK